MKQLPIQCQCTCRFSALDDFSATLTPLVPVFSSYSTPITCFFFALTHYTLISKLSLTEIDNISINAFQFQTIHGLIQGPENI